MEPKAGDLLTVKIDRLSADGDGGLGFLEDGTMVLVYGGERHIGETVVVRVEMHYLTVKGTLIRAVIDDDT